jgi:hypothetical protein
MGIDRVIQEQRDKDKHEKQFQKDIKSITSTTNINSNQPLNTEHQSKHKNENIPQRKDYSTITTRNPEHKKKIEIVKSMLNLK